MTGEEFEKGIAAAVDERDREKAFHLLAELYEQADGPQRQKLQKGIRN